MAELFINLPVPAADGAGAWVDCSTLGSLRTLVCGVTLGPSGEGMRCTVNIQISNANAAPVADNEAAPLCTFNNDFGEDITVNVAAKWMRAVRSGSKTPAGTPSVTVGSTNDGTTINNLPATAGDGNGAGVDVSAMGPFKTVTVGGAFRGNVNVELSEDGTFFSPEFSFPGNGGQQSKAFAAKFMRVNRDGVPVNSPGLPVVNIGAAAMPGGGGGGGSGNAQRFTYVATGAEGSDFVVTLPGVRLNDLYLIWSSWGSVASILGIQFPNALAGDRTTSQFRCVTTAALTAGDEIMFYVDDPT